MNVCVLYFGLPVFQISKIKSVVLKLEANGLDVYR